MRRNFAQVLRAGRINIKNEYSKLYRLFYEVDESGESDADYVSDNIQNIYFCGTCLDLDEFNQMYGFHFEEQPQDFDIDYLVGFCEYIYNFAVYLGCSYIKDFSFYVGYISKVIGAIGYMESREDSFTIFVPKDSVAISVAESEKIPQDLSYKIISYNNHSMKGNLQGKKNTILRLTDLLEPKRKDLDKVDKTLSSDLFYLFNNLNLRHNNIDPASKGKYKQAVAEMDQGQLETWYDEIYQMCLFAFMSLEQADRKVKINELKQKIEEK